MSILPVKGPAAAGPSFDGEAEKYGSFIRACQHQQLYVIKSLFQLEDIPPNILQHGFQILSKMPENPTLNKIKCLITLQMKLHSQTPQPEDTDLSLEALFKQDNGQTLLSIDLSSFSSAYMENLLIRSILQNRICFCLALLDQYTFSKEILLQALQITTEHQKEFDLCDFAPGTTITVQEPPSQDFPKLVEDFTPIDTAIKTKLRSTSFSQKAAETRYR